MFHPTWRRRALASLERPFDLVIVGGGITGCGIFLDAAQRGLRALLVERSDIASGTSSRSSKLVHGGLRYLKEFQFSVTRHSCYERDLQLSLSPHLVDPLPWVYPAYRGDRPQGWKVELGLAIYDRLTNGPEKHRRLSPEELTRLTPHLPRKNLDRALSYIDGRTDDARLTLAVAATGMACGGHLLTRAVPEEGLFDASGRLTGLVLRDLLNDDGGDAVHRVEASLVINATGTWADHFRERLGFEGKRLRPSRGSHLIFRRETLPLEVALTVHSPDDQRPVFFIPHPEGVLVGTTDLFHHGEFDDPRPSRQEVDYLLRTAAVAFPNRPPRAKDIMGAFAGVRPVIDDGAATPSAASREEAIWHENGLLSVAGGKLTTWRSTAEQVVDIALGHLPAERRRRAAPCATAGTPLAGRAPFDLAERLLAAHSDLEPAVAGGMARRLASLAWTACELAQDRGDRRPLAPGVDLCAAEVRAHLRYGGVLHLTDLLLRRVRIGMWRPDLARELVPRLRKTMCRELGWSHQRWNAEVERYAASAQAWAPEGVQEAEVTSSAEGGA